MEDPPSRQSRSRPHHRSKPISQPACDQAGRWLMGDGARPQQHLGPILTTHVLWVWPLHGLNYWSGRMPNNGELPKLLPHRNRHQHSTWNGQVLHCCQGVRHQRSPWNGRVLRCCQAAAKRHSMEAVTDRTASQSAQSGCWRCRSSSCNCASRASQERTRTSTRTDG